MDTAEIGGMCRAQCRDTFLGSVTQKGRRKQDSTVIYRPNKNDSLEQVQREWASPANKLGDSLETSRNRNRKKESKSSRETP